MQEKKSTKTLWVVSLMAFAILIVSITTYVLISHNKKIKNESPIIISDNTKTVTVYAYCPCEICNEQWPGLVSLGYKMSDYTDKGQHICAADPTVIPYNTIIKYDNTEYLVVDTGAAIKGDTINILLDSHAETLKFGIKKDQIIEIVSSDKGK